MKHITKDTIKVIAFIIVLVVAIIVLMYFGIHLGKNDVVVKDVDFSKYTTEDVNDNKTIGTSGVYRYSGNYTETITINASRANIKIILDNADINTTGPAINVVDADVVYIELVNDNTIKATPTEDLNGAIYSKADLLFMGDGKITIDSSIDGIVGKDDVKIVSGNYIIKASDDGIVGKDSLVIEDGNYEFEVTGDGLKTSNEEEKGNMEISKGVFNITSKGDGITSIANLTIKDGTFNINSGSGERMTSNSPSMKGIKANGDITITDGTFKITSTDDSIHTNSNMNLNGGTIECSSNDDGIHADNNLIIKDGKVTITKSYEGLEGKNITIDGGDISINATDDGMNAAGGDGSTYGRPGAPRTTKETSVITINGGNIYVNASGDGIDSNGDIYIKGGVTHVDGPTNNGNGPMDYGDFGDYKFEVTGGELIAVGAKGMAVSPTSSTVPTVFMNLDNAYNTEFTFGDISYKPSKAYNSILICSNKLKQNETYDLKISNVRVLSLTLNKSITTYGSSGFGGGPRR